MARGRHTTIAQTMLLPFLALNHPQIDPVLISLGPVQIHWYGVGYMVGILFGWWYAKKLVRTQKLWQPGSSPITETQIDDFLVWAVAGIILGGRLGYVLFYNLPAYLENPLLIFAVWEGGMSFHGGLLGMVLVMILFARRNGFSPFNLFDVITASAGICILLVRITNFINAELYGSVTDLPWGVVFPGTEGLPRHPSQLYEGFTEGLLLFFILAWLIWRQGKLSCPGFVAGTFALGYGLFRILIEFVRLPDAHIGYLLGTGWLTMGMILSLPLVVVGTWAIATAKSRIVSDE